MIPVEICQKAIRKFGEEHQKQIAIEELSELILALSHERRGKNTPYDVAGEIADVQIMIWQLSQMYPDVLRRIDEKLNRLSSIV